ncbi:hypothetical protein QL285_069381 [Trifolium repens]|nr:hypothetical protein QL285_069381 [Trifolium repens]
MIRENLLLAMCHTCRRSSKLWLSKLQVVVALSMTEAEYMAELPDMQGSYLDTKVNEGIHPSLGLIEVSSLPSCQRALFSYHHRSKRLFLLFLQHC